MKKKLFTNSIFALSFFLITNNWANAKVWRINNTPGITADFTTAEIALNSTTAGKVVATDDTLYIEGSTLDYGVTTLDKKVVMIGNGYFLGAALPNNIGLQANTNNSTISALLFTNLGAGSSIIGINIGTFGVGSTAADSGTDDITLTRCNISSIGQYYGFTVGGVMSGWKINKCYIGSLSISTVKLENWEIRNNIFTGGLTADFSGNSVLLIRNNVLRSTVDINNCYFANNIITTSFTAVNTTAKNNIATGANTLPTGNSNLNGQTDANLFVGLMGNSTDGQWKLKAGSPAIAAGETVSAITPDCGAYGTADPYLLSGIPPIPTIYALTVPANTATNQLNITISTKSNN